MDCVEANNLDIALARYHKPLLKFSGAERILENAVLAISSYPVPEKNYIITVSSYLGAT
jgi:hypothetical protein